MQPQRPLIRFTTGLLACITASGCALYGPMARHGGQQFDSAAQERLVDIATMFDQQGHHEQAEKMFRRVVDADPSNLEAQNGLTIIASRRKTREFNAPLQSVPGSPSPSQPSNLIAGTHPPPASVRGVERYESEAPRRIHAIAQQRQVTQSRQTDRCAISDRGQKQEHLVLAEPTNTDLPAVPSESTYAPTTSSQTASRAVPLIIEPAISPRIESAPRGNRVENAIPQPVETTSISGPTAVATADRSPTAAQSDMEIPVIPGPSETTLTNVSYETAGPEQTKLLLTTLEQDNDDVRRAVAANLLSTMPTEDTRIDLVLEQYSGDPSPLVAVAACESLLSRDQLSDRMMLSLLSLCEHADPTIRGHACISMRQLAGTPWQTDIVEALILRLNDTAPSVRATAAMTLSEFPNLEEMILDRLESRYSLESDEEVIRMLDLSTERIAQQAADEGSPLSLAE